MCPDCFELYAKLSDLNSRLAAQTREFTKVAPTETERYQALQTELAEMRRTCVQVRQELQQHREQHEAFLSSRGTAMTFT